MCQRDLSPTPAASDLRDGGEEEILERALWAARGSLNKEFVVGLA